MRNPIDPNLPPIELPECGTDNRVLYVAAIACLLVLATGVWLVWRLIAPLCEETR